MNFSEYSKRLYPHMSGLHNQSHFVGSLFNAAGSTFFPIQGAYGTDDNQRKLYAGSRVFNKNMKASFLSPINRQGLTTFFDAHIGDTSLLLIMANFSVPSEEAQNKALFISALCTQFQNIVSEAANEVDDIVSAEYNRLLHVIGAETITLFPLYPNDDLQLINECPINDHAVAFYEDFEHQWIIRNSGNVSWEGRQLECVNHNETRIRAVNIAIGIPRTTPGEEVILMAQFNARGFEGVFESVWIMKDSDGRVCFPDGSKALKIAVTVENRNGKPAEVC